MINKRYFETARFTGVFLTVMLAATPLAQPAAAAQPNRPPAGSSISKQHVAASLTQRAAEGTPATEPAARLLDSNRPTHAAATIRQHAYLKASNAEAIDNFFLVAVDGDTMVVGAGGEDGSITSTLGSPNNDAIDAGAAYVYTRSMAGTWTQAAYLKASNAEASDSFGWSVALSGDTIVVGAPNEAGSITSTLGSPNNAAVGAGAAYVFTRSAAGTWTQAAYLKASNAEAGDFFGSVAISGDTIVVGAATEAGSITSTVGSPNNPNNEAVGAGAAYVFTRSVAGTWTQAAYLKASNAEAGDQFGVSVAVDDDTIIVGALYESGSVTSTLGSENNAEFGAGAAYVYTRSVAGTWTQAAYLKASNAEANDLFGYPNVAISGDTIVVGSFGESGSVTSTVGLPNNEAPSAGAAYVYERSMAGTWTQAAYLKASNANAGDQFGSSVALSSDTIVVGAPYEDGSITSTIGSPNNDAVDAGAAYVYERSLAGTWTQAAYLKASNAETDDWFGESVALSGSTIAVGARTEDGSITSTMGSPNNLTSAAGAVYEFKLLYSLYVPQVGP